MLNYQTFSEELLQALTDRKREVLEKRFGLMAEGPLTLQAIGDELGITRERVRQIENDALLTLRHEQAPKLNKPFQLILDYLQKHGGLREERILLKDLGEDRFQNHIALFLTLGDDFKKFKETEEFFPLWTTEEKKVQEARNIIKELIRELKRRNDLMEAQEMSRRVSLNIELPVLISYIDISKYIFQSPFGHYGLVDWPEVRPRGLRDNAYLVLKKEGQPLHFTEIARKIGELPNSPGAVLPESVHNELIRNEKFVLIGRGIYALREWGYNPGTVEDVIKSVLKKANKPLTREEIIKKVLEQRDVKESTVVLNLQSKKEFKKDQKGKYSLA